MKQVRSKYNLTLLFVALLFLFQSCEEFLEIPTPNDQITTKDVFSTAETIGDVVNGMYHSYSTQYAGDIVKNASVMSDEAVIYPITGSSLGNLVSANITPDNGVIRRWSEYYKTIYDANLILENLEDISPEILTEKEKNMYMGAARFVRSETHFLLVNTWGNIPLVTTTDAEYNSTIFQSPAEDIYEFVITDLEKAVGELPDEVTSAPTIHNKYQALALLARVYLYTENWEKAEAAATEVINSGKYQLLEGDLTKVFLKGSAEGIVSLAEYGNSKYYVNRATLGWYSLPSSIAVINSYPHITDSVLTRVEAGDKRWQKNVWIQTLFNVDVYQFQNKYRHSFTATDEEVDAYPQNYILLRYAEQFLIRAEARAHQNKIELAASDVNTIRKRAGLGNIAASDQEAMLKAIENERVLELYYEGHRWYDLARTGRLDEVVSKLPYKAANWKPEYRYLPILTKDLDSNPNLIQNKGY